jgi:hypothetical protein
MPGYIERKNPRIKTFATLKYRGYKLAGEGIIKNISLTGGYIIGNTPVTVGMVLALRIFVPGEAELLVIDRVTVKWVKKTGFGVHFDSPKLEVAKRITQVISTLVNTQHDSSGER